MVGASPNSDAGTLQHQGADHAGRPPVCGQRRGCIWVVVGLHRDDLVQERMERRGAREGAANGLDELFVGAGRERVLLAVWVGRWWLIRQYQQFGDAAERV